VTVPANEPVVEKTPRKELIIGYKGDTIVSEGPMTDLLEWNSGSNVYECLVGLTPDLQVEPLLATDWEYMGDNTWRFYLRQGVKFHDGQEFNADTVKYTFDEALRPSATSLINLDENSVNVIDEYTVDITTTIPSGRVPELLTHVSYGIKAPGSDRGKHPIGTGPLEFVSYEKDKQIVLARYKDYWGEKAEIETMIFKFIPDPVTRVMALESGDVDAIVQVPEEMVSQIEATEGLKVIYSPYAAAHSQIRVRVRGPENEYIVNDRAVRLAMGYALDRTAMVEGAWSGIGTVNQCELPPELLGEYSSLVEGFSYNPDKARELLEQAGWQLGDDGIRSKDGQRLSLTIVSGYNDWGGRVAESVPQIMQDQFKDVGIESEIIIMTDPGLKGEKLEEGYGHAWLGQTDQNNADPTMWPAFICHSGRYYGLVYSGVWSPGEEFDSVIDEAIEAPDFVECQRLTAEALHVLIDQEAVMIPLALTYNIFAAKEDVEGFVPHSSMDNTLWYKAH
jgi:peptide/nickel transport system substrate-binding protein